MRTTDIKFVDPPPSLNGLRKKHDEKAAALKARPGEWAFLFSSKGGAESTRIKQGTASAFRPAGAFEAVSRKNRAESRLRDVYARYVGEHGEYR